MSTGMVICGTRPGFNCTAKTRAEAACHSRFKRQLAGKSVARCYGRHCLCHSRGAAAENSGLVQILVRVLLNMSGKKIGDKAVKSGCPVFGSNKNIGRKRSKIFKHSDIIPGFAAQENLFAGHLLLRIKVLEQKQQGRDANTARHQKRCFQAIRDGKPLSQGPDKMYRLLLFPGGHDGCAPACYPVEYLQGLAICSAEAERTPEERVGVVAYLQHDKLPGPCLPGNSSAVHAHPKKAGSNSPVIQKLCVMYPGKYCFLFHHHETRSGRYGNAAC
jgi:hypothetical protein